jgi:hypothetical protein
VTDPTITAEIARMPWGEFEGAPVLAVDISHGVQAHDLIAKVTAFAHDGIHVLWLRSAPWGETALDQAISHVQNDHRYWKWTFLATRSLDSDMWSMLNLNLVCLVSRLLIEPVSLDTVAERLRQIRYFPTLREVVAVRPHRRNLTPAILDEIANYTNIGAGWIYAPPDDHEYEQTALDATARTGTPWAVRFDRNPDR